VTIKTFIGTACLFTMLQMQAANANQSGQPTTIRTGVQVLTSTLSVEPVYVDADGVGNY
jgi:hypothetical protein